MSESQWQKQGATLSHKNACNEEQEIKFKLEQINIEINSLKRKLMSVEKRKHELIQIQINLPVRNAHLHCIIALKRLMTFERFYRNAGLLSAPSPGYMILAFFAQDSELLT